MYYKTQAKDLKNKYQKWCDTMNVKPMVDSEKVIDDLFTIPSPSEKKMDKNRETALFIYRDNCEVFGLKPSSEIDTLPTYTIWDYIIRDINITVEKLFKAEFDKITNIKRQGHIRSAIRTLYDQDVFVTPQTNGVEVLLNAETDEKIKDAFRALGGEGLIIFEENFEEEEIYEDDDENE